MVPLEKTHSDQQLADVLNYIGERWHNWKKPVDASTVGRARAELKDRTAPWSYEELMGLQFVQ